MKRSSSVADCGSGVWDEVELAEGVLELLAHPLERRVRLCRDHRADVFEREPDRAGLERGEPRRRTEGLAVELLVHVHFAVGQLGVDRVAAAAEVDEVEEREVILQVLVGDAKALDDLRRLDGRLPILAAAREQVREQSLEHCEPLRCYRACRPLAGAVRRRSGRLACQPGRLAGMGRVHGFERARNLAPQLGRIERHRPAVLPEHPRREHRQRRIVRDEDAVLESSGVAVGALEPPGRVAGHLDSRLALDFADLPRWMSAVLVDVEVGRRAEIALAARRKPDVAADARDAKLLAPLILEVLGDHIPDAVVRQQCVRVERSLRLAVA